MSSPAFSPDIYDVDAPDGSGSNSPYLGGLYFLIAVLAFGLACFLIGRLLLSQWRAVQGDGAGWTHTPETHDGLSMSAIAALPTFKYWARAVPTPSLQRSWGGNGRSGSTTTGTAAAASAVCVICLKELADGDVVRVLPACRHFFHGHCIDRWLRKKSSCPVCRAYPEPERALRPGEAALLPPLPQLCPFDVSAERPTPAKRIFADILARTPLRIRGSTSGSNERIASRSSTPSPVALTGGMVDERCSSSSELPQMLEAGGCGGSVAFLNDVRPPAYDDVRLRVGEYGCERAVVAIPPATLAVESSPHVPN